MINQLRTLLLNQPSNTIPLTSYPGEEFVTTDYEPKTLNDGLATVSKLLFGVAPDRAMLNLRLRQILGIVHTTELAEYVYALDPRVTYWPPRNNDLFTMLDGPPDIVNVSGTKDLYILGNVPPFVAGDQVYFSYLIEVVDGANVKISSLTEPVPVTTSPYVITAGLSSAVSLPGSDLSFKFQAGVGSIWTVTWLAYPAKSLSDMYNDLKQDLTDDLVAVLFGTHPSEPMLTFKNLWLYNPYPPYQIAAVVMALGYQTNNLTV
jgi:hypothetical protein